MKQNSFCKNFLDAYSSLMKSLGSKDMIQQFPCLLEDFENIQGKMKNELASGVENIFHYEDAKLIAEEITALTVILSKYPNLCEGIELNILRILSIATGVDAGFYAQETEGIMRCGEIEKFLDENVSSIEVQLLFADIMQNTVKISCDSLAFSYGYKIFMDWLPLRKEKYPQVIEAVAKELRYMNDKKKIRTSEERELYNLYNFDHQIV